MQPREFLIFHLWGPMASWGEIAVGERRGSWSRPSRSAILGLVGAALGVERTDAPAHGQLEERLGFAVRVDNPGKPLRDYHTAQSPSQRRGARWATRRDELGGANDINTILSERGYYLEMDVVVALWARSNAPGHSLKEIAASLDEPVFTLYLGRKSCPLGLPLAPRIVESESLCDALQVYDEASKEPADKLGAFSPGRSHSRRRDPRRQLWLGEKDAQTLGLLDEKPPLQRTQRRDGVRDRPRWLFDDRAEVEIEISGRPS
jgi:CRISPR system Cascade subunit CasD